MNIDESIERLKGIIYASHSAYFKNFELMYQDVDAIETIINEYNNLKQIEEAHRIENGKLREENEKLNAEVIENICYRVDTEVFEEMREELKQEKEKNNKIEKYIRSNEWAEDYEKSSCRTKILRILEEE